MELALSLGDASKPFTFLDKTQKLVNKDAAGFCMGLGTGILGNIQDKAQVHSGDQDEKRVSSDPPVQLDLLPFSPVPRHHPSSQLRFPWLADNRESAIPPLISFYLYVFLLIFPHFRCFIWISDDWVFMGALVIRSDA